ncbi:EpsG family protein [Pseudaeromonas paramecii]|uniref:EpsG family protein n=1 Tax=Pseudaeromonas paramecii TaxID=2138166 RepID=UPI0031E93DF4
MYSYRKEMVSEFSFSLSYIKLSFIFFNLILGAFIPFFSFWLSIFTFALLERKDAFLLKVNLLVFAFYSSVVYSSRAFFLTPSDDYIRYFEVYKASVLSWYDLYFSEPGLLLLYNLLNVVGLDLSVSGLAFVTSLLSTLLLSVFFYCLVRGDENIRHPGLCLSLSFAFISFDYINQLVRQSISLTFLLLCLLPIARNKKIVCYFFAAMFHFSSIFIGGLMMCLRYHPLKSIVVLLFLFALLYFVIGHFSFLGGVAARLEYYQGGVFEFSWYIKYVLIILFSSLFLYVFGIHDKGWLYKFLLSSAFVLVVVSPLGLISLRVLLFYIAYLIGLHMYVVFERVKTLLVIIFSFVMVYKLYRLLGLGSQEDVFSLWRTYEPFSMMPFYYFLEY